jgi:putative exosortase-associated protein (TIGR04073 family)
MIAAGLVVALLIVVGSVGRAGADDSTRKRNDITLMFRKFSRGVVNILTGWVEVPKNISLRWKETDPFSGTLFGLFEGLAWAFAREVGGVYEIVSFPFPYPDNYAPLIEPEFILTPIWGEAAPFMTSEPVNPAKSFE